MCVRLSWPDVLKKGEDGHYYIELTTLKHKVPPVPA